MKFNQTCNWSAYETTPCIYIIFIRDSYLRLKTTAAITIEDNDVCIMYCIIMYKRQLHFITYCI